MLNSKIVLGKLRIYLKSEMTVQCRDFVFNREGTQVLWKTKCHLPGYSRLETLIMKVAVIRRAHFNAAHRLHNPAWTDERNRAVFGLCNNVNYHGHNYELEVKVTGEVDPDTGYVIDLGWLAELIKAEVENRFDHHNLNLDTVEFRDLNPTAENICVVIWQILRPHLPETHDLQIRLYETPRNFVEYPV